MTLLCSQEGTGCFPCHWEEAPGAVGWASVLPNGMKVGELKIIYIYTYAFVSFDSDFNAMYTKSDFWLWFCFNTETNFSFNFFLHSNNPKPHPTCVQLLTVLLIKHCKCPEVVAPFKQEKIMPWTVSLGTEI